MYVIIERDMYSHENPELIGVKVEQPDAEETAKAAFRQYWASIGSEPPKREFLYARVVALEEPTVIY